MKKFLVIDDSEDRRSSYCKVFNFLELDFAFSKKEFLEKVKNKYDGYFIDVIYEEQQYEEFSFQQILEYVPDNKPLFIISERWSSAMDGMKMGYLINSKKYSNVLGYLSWTIINGGDIGENVKDFVRQQINNYYRIAFEAFGENQNVTILQISDIEFGNPGQQKNIEMAGELFKSNVRKKLKKLNVETNKVDFICVCGDIAYRGEKEEYKKAEEWLKKLAEELLMNEDMSNILFVPGNHDFCFNAAAGNYYMYDKDKRDYFSRKDACLDYNEHGMYNFAKFVYRMNGENSYIYNPYRPIVNRRYEDYGINFIMLNPIKIGTDKRFTYRLSDNDMKHLLEEANAMTDKDVCNIVLSHIAYDKYSVIDPTSSSVSKEIRNIVDELNIKGWLEGHAHDNVKIDDVRISRDKVLVSRTETLMLESSEHCEGACNGFTILKLYREKGKVIDISHYDDKEDKEVSYKHLFN